MDHDVGDYLAALVGRARAVLGDNLVGAYAAGSVGLGAYQPGRSDVDVALVTAGPVTGPAKRELVARLRHESLPCPARGLELVAYRRDVAGSGIPDPGFEVELNTGAAMPFRATYDPAERPAADGWFWYALDRSILRQAGLALLGPPPVEVFADPAPADLRGLLVTALDWWLALPTPAGDAPAPGAEDAVLGACRSLVRVRTGAWLSKVDAGRWLMARGRHAELIGRAVAARQGGPAPSGPEARPSSGGSATRSPVRIDDGRQSTVNKVY
ncbi:aminoglycoside adenylyltransferase domain-containing protein [Micromonospora sp. MS34]|uniref:aminoglycoside adenylyltransferase domain-containing protein n=1 Tax=Micromonospora sp. MS34 TaxID=3385971 RepID=UPI0039A3252A